MTVPRLDPARRGARLPEWPREDQLAWAHINRATDIFEDEPAPGAAWRPATRDKHLRIYGLWIGHLQRNNPAALLEPPARRATPARVEAYLGTLRGRDLASRTLWGYVVTLYVISRTMAPKTDWSWLDRTAKRLLANAKPVRSIIDRLRPASELLAGAMKEMDACETRQARNDTDRSSWYRDALMVAILASRAPRHKNLVEMRLHRHLVLIDGRYRLRFSAFELKAGPDYDEPLPDALIPYVDYYLACHRPVLAQDRETDAVWVSNKSRPLDYSAAGKQIRTMTRRVFGVAINSQAFRHANATSTAIEDPEHVHEIAAVLHHSTPLTGGKYYNMAGSVTASRRHQAGILALRARSKRFCRRR